MPVSNKSPRTTHTWLKGLYDYLDDGVRVTVPSGASGYANAVNLGGQVPYTIIGNASGLVGVYGSSGIAGQLASGTAGITGVTGMGANTGPAAWWFNGGTGSWYTLSDLVTAMKNAGILKP